MRGLEGEECKKCRWQEMLEFRRGDLKVRMINSWSTKRKLYGNIGVFKRRIRSTWAKLILELRGRSICRG